MLGALMIEPSGDPRGPLLDVCRLGRPLTARPCRRRGTGEDRSPPTLSFAGDMVRLQRAFSESHAAVVRRGVVLETLNLRTGERVLELGCGGGYYTREAAQFVAPKGRVCDRRDEFATGRQWGVVLLH